MKKKGMGSEARAELMAKADADLELLNHAEQERQLQKQKKRRNQGREEDVCTHLTCKKLLFCYQIHYNFFLISTMPCDFAVLGRFM